MQGSTRRRPITRTPVAAGSIWETRMRIDQVKGGIKVFNGGDDNAAVGDEEGSPVPRRLRRIQSDGVAAADKRKRKSWRPPDSPPAIRGPVERSPIQLRKARSDLCNPLRITDGNCLEIGGENIVDSGSGNADATGEKREVDFVGGEVELEEEVEMDDDDEMKSFDDKEIVIPPEEVKTVDEEKRINQIHEIPLSANVEKNPPIVIHHQIPVNPPPVELEEEVFETVSVGQNRMQNIVDLVMWRDISKSVLVFGFGTFILISSSYTKDVNFSLISAISYLGLIYLALVFLYKSILHRGGMNMDFDEMNGRDMVGEDEAIWLLRMVLPYINEMLVKLRAFFCGDPAITMKLAVLLFVMARCGSSINICTLSKLVFFGIFTIPKVCSTYRDQITRYAFAPLWVISGKGNFWVERFRDGWESCTHKKAVAAAAFTLIWNVSSTVARIWAVFMLVVAVRLYQQHRTEEWCGEEEEVEEETVVVQQREEDPKVAALARRRQRVGHTVTKVNGREIKLRKWS